MGGANIQKSLIIKSVEVKMLNENSPLYPSDLQSLKLLRLLILVRSRLFKSNPLSWIIKLYQEPKDEAHCEITGFEIQ